jgi:hypothetical protein
MTRHFDSSGFERGRGVSGQGGSLGLTGLAGGQDEQGRKKKNDPKERPSKVDPIAL